MQLKVVEHPLVSHKLSLLRQKTTPSSVFRALVDELVTLLAYEATRDSPVEATQVETPLKVTDGVRLREPQPLVVPVLRAGLGMLEGMLHLLPTAEVGFLGMRRDETTLEIETYAQRLPEDLRGRHCFVLDPMLATGHTMVSTIEFLLEQGAADITAICLLSAPEGLREVKAKISNRVRDLKIITAAVDEGLNEQAYIVPGLGDAGDRLYGIVD